MDADVAAALLYDAVDGSQTQPRSSASFLRCEEGLEDARLHRWAHAGSGVADRQGHIGTRLEPCLPWCVVLVEIHFGCLDCECAAVRHGVTGVDDEVHDDLLDLARVRFDEAWFRVHSENELYVLSNEPSKHLLDLSQNDVDFQDPWFDDLLATESQQLPRQGGGTLPGLVDLFDLVA